MGIKKFLQKTKSKTCFTWWISKKANTISEGKVFGFDSEFTVYDKKDSYSNLLVGLSYLGRLEAPHYVSYPFEDLTNSFSARIDYNSDNFYLNYEYVYNLKMAL